MCGIAGVSLRPGCRTESMVIAKLLATMGDSLAHRGPDGSGTFIADNLGLVHRRLAIVDVTGGQQPFTTSDDRVALVANGEIYNHALLRQRLLQQGTTCSTQSDCEPPLHLYDQHGATALNHLEGMYGLAIADARTGELILARDPFGIKPLYYLESSQGFAFASEPRALLALNWQPHNVATSQLPQLLGEHFTSGENTLLTGIQRVLPGERLTVWDGQIINRERRPLPVAAGKIASHNSFAAEFEAAVARHLAPEVPMGLFLSGGIDSTALLVAFNRLGIKLNTYTAHFAEQPSAEQTLASEIAKRFGMTPHNICYTPDDFWRDLHDMAWSMDDLVLDYAILPSLKLARIARADGIKVIFSGEGGDEILAGYKRYRLSPWQRMIRALPGHQRGGWQKLAPYLRNPMRLPEQLQTQRDQTNHSRLQTQQFQNITGSLVDDLLPKLDRSLMRHGLEGRVPFLDDRFAAYAFNLPDNQKIQCGFGKWILRTYLAEAGLPELAWQKKQGFTVPASRWLLPWQHEISQLWLNSPLLAEILKPGAAKALLSAFTNNPRLGEPVFSLTILALWHNHHVEAQHKPANPSPKLPEKLAMPPPLHQPSEQHAPASGL